MSMKGHARLLVAGCGAATEQFYVPALAARSDLAGRLLFLDLSRERSNALAKRMGGESVSSIAEARSKGAAAAILATPHHVHHQQAVEALDHGLHLFIEKPVTISEREAREIADKAQETGCLVMVNNNRRLFPSFQSIHDLIRSGDLGAFLGGEVHDGSEFEWPTVSGFYLTSKEAKGVLLDRGAHTIDILTWWLGETLAVASAGHDGFNGPDATFHLSLQHEAGAKIDLKFSRLVKLSNSYHLRFENGELKGRVFTWDKYERRRPGGKWDTVTAEGFNPRAYNEFVYKMTNHFLDAVFSNSPPPFDIHSVIPSIALMERAYEVGVPFELPWYAEWKAG